MVFQNVTICMHGLGFGNRHSCALHHGVLSSIIGISGTIQALA